MGDMAINSAIRSDDIQVPAAETEVPKQATPECKDSKCATGVLVEITTGAGTDTLGPTVKGSLGILYAFVNRPNVQLLAGLRAGVGSTHYTFAGDPETKVAARVFSGPQMQVAFGKGPTLDCTGIQAYAGAGISVGIVSGAADPIVDVSIPLEVGLKVSSSINPHTGLAAVAFTLGIGLDFNVYGTNKKVNQTPLDFQLLRAGVQF